jgi:sulfatase maturation enzyme AslB (radical SAM superfamily)
MELEHLVLILTDACNFACSYCYAGRGAQRLDPSTLLRAIDLFRPYFARDCLVSFYGGEPLLEFGLIRTAVERLESSPRPDGQRIRFAVTTNGSLLDDEILAYLDRHGFAVTLSFDGLAQDLTRGQGTFAPLVSLIPRILARPSISLETNSVFSAETVGYLAGSVELLVRLGVPRFDLNLAHKPAWIPDADLRLEKEIGRVGEFLLSRYDDIGSVPWTYYAENDVRAVHYCSAGVDRMAVSAQGTIWGCAVFPRYLSEEYGPSGAQEYCFGDLDTFAKDSRTAYSRTITAYAALRMDRFSTPERPCSACDELESCWVCPLAAGLTSGEIGRIAASTCRRAMAFRAGKRRFLERLGDRARPGR